MSKLLVLILALVVFILALQALSKVLDCGYDDDGCWFDHDCCDSLKCGYPDEFSPLGLCYRDENLFFE
ncbi:hypothetical protein KQX54_013936 [Cotesia glomerata]|uniref:Uncharacterized protein n=1 Tax=Cotesia glomerata TaxID=32391 RepID=A0AAV7IQP9_COTGL|nr:hypothetical protein KQX54_013936 [Cotesia glomerata]